jgi:hypothetical protein
MSRLLHVLGSLWCRLMHRQISWPLCGHYVCFQCGRSFDVTWHGRTSVSDPSVPQPIRSMEALRHG